MQKTFTKAEKDMLMEKHRNAQIAQGLLNEWVGFLEKQYAVKQPEWRILADGSGFELVEKPKSVKPKE